MRKAPSIFSHPARSHARGDGFVFEPLEKREVFDVTVNSAINDIVQNSAGSVVTVSLLGRYTDTAVTQIARLVTTAGNIDIALSGTLAPNTVANFLAYLNAGFYNNTIFHRSQRPTPTIPYALIQGGGFRPPTTDYNGAANATNQPALIPAGELNPAVDLEHPTGNTAFSVGLARSNAPNSGTSQFYINVTDNSNSFDAASNPPGYSTFGTVLELTRANVTTLNNYTYYDASGVFNSALGSMPLLRPAPLTLPVTPADYVVISGSSVVTDLTGVETAIWSATVTTNPSLVTVSVNSAGSLTITPNAAGTRGTATIRLRATSADGSTFTDDEFTFELANFAPTIGAIQGQSNIAVGGSMLVNAMGIHDNDAVGTGGIASVGFWYDTDGNGELDTGVDTLVGTDDSSAGGWNARIDTSAMHAGANTIFARVTDTDGATADSHRVITLRDAVPGSGVTPGTTTVASGTDVNLGFDPALPDTAGIRRISSFIDSNNDGVLDPLTDHRIGFATYNTGTSSWGFTVDHSELTVGANRVFSRVSDNYGNLGGITSSIITVTA